MSKLKKILILAGVILVVVLLVALLGKATGSFENLFQPDEWSVVDVNTENVYQQLTFADADGIIADGEDGVYIETDEDNVLKVDGVAKTTKTYIIGTTTLKSGTSYVFDSSLTDGSKGTVYMSVRNTATDTVIVSSTRGAVVIDALDADTAVAIEITIVAETDVSETLRPILCEGETVDDKIAFWK